jgi:hypothetical protein
VRQPLVERQVGLAGVAILAVAVSLSVATRREHAKVVAALPAPVGAYSALAAATGPRAAAKETSCGIALDRRLAGIYSPVLPCGIRLYLGYRSHHVLASVVGRPPTVVSAQFGLTPALARRLGVKGVRRIHWSYAASA